MSESAIPLEEQIVEVRREVATRRRVYPRWIARGDIPAELAEQRLAAMEAVLETLKRINAPELPL